MISPIMDPTIQKIRRGRREERRATQYKGGAQAELLARIVKVQYHPQDNLEEMKAVEEQVMESQVVEPIGGTV